jgi:hypothetical protein
MPQKSNAQKDATITSLTHKLRVRSTSSIASDTASFTAADTNSAAFLETGPYALSLLSMDGSVNSSPRSYVSEMPASERDSAAVSAGTPIDVYTAWGNIWNQSSILSSRINRHEWDILQDEGVKWTQQLIHYFRDKDMKVIKNLTEELKTLSSRTEQAPSSSSISKNDNGVDVDDETDSGDNPYIVSADLADSSSIRRKYVRFKTKNQLSVDSSSAYDALDASRRNHMRYSFGQVLCSFLAGLALMTISSAIVIWQLFDFDLLKD